jgi:hypothetical protein
MQKSRGLLGNQVIFIDAGLVYNMTALTVWQREKNTM